MHSPLTSLIACYIHTILIFFFGNVTKYQTLHFTRKVTWKLYICDSLRLELMKKLIITLLFGDIWYYLELISGIVWGWYELVISRFRVQYDQYSSSFSYFTNLFHEPFGEWNRCKIWETRKILAILCEKIRAITGLLLLWKYLLSVNVIQQWSREKTQQ